MIPWSHGWGRFPWVAVSELLTAGVFRAPCRPVLDLPPEARISTC